jgi:1-acyl-sn-glycerol-3-phosphate acyltransferase
VARLAESLTTRLATQSIRAGCRLIAHRIEITVDGLQHLPPEGPAILAARHFHHLYDGCALIAVVPRPVHIVVTLDWMHNKVGKPLLEAACRAAGWPIVPRTGGQRLLNATTGPGTSMRARQQLLSATRECVELLNAGQFLLVFPEGYPNIDPGYTPKLNDEAWLPFQPGFVRIALIAEREARIRVPIIPVGLQYERGERWQVAVRIGEPLKLDRDADAARQVRVIENQVRQLSGTT